MIPAIIPAVVAAVGAIGAAGIQASSAKKNRISQEKQNAIDRRRAATAYQTAVSDMRAAGMNPITGQNPPQAASTPMPAPQSDMTGVGQVVQQGASAVGDLLQKNQQALQDQSLSWYQNQVNSTNDMVNKLQDIVKDYQSQINQTVEGLSEDAKAYLKEIEEQRREYLQKVNEISDSQEFSVEQLSKLGITVSQKDSEGTTDTDSEKNTRDVNIGFTAGFSLTNFFSAQGNVGAGFGHEEGKQKTKQKTKETSKQGQVESTSGVRSVTGRQLKNAVTHQIESQFRAKLQDSGSEKINQNLKSIDRDSYVRLTLDLTESKSQLRKYREYADYLRDNPGESLKSYRGFIDGFKNKNINSYLFDKEKDAEHRTIDSDLFESFEENYPDVSTLKAMYPSLYIQFEGVLDDVDLTEEEKDEVMKQALIKTKQIVDQIKKKKKTKK